MATVGVGACGDPDLAPGVSRILAEERARLIGDLAYEVRLVVPAVRDSAVSGQVTVRFTLREATRRIVLDFRAPTDHLGEVRLDGERVAVRLVPDHIVVPAADLAPGPHELSLVFRSTDTALNRGDDLLYALFVPDRASTAFPVFEQPDLKARFTLSLSLPAGWQGMSNGTLVVRDSAAGRQVLRFAATEPISTYLFAFAAGAMRVERAVRDGRVMRLYHRETDAAKVARNAPAIFDLHAASLRWLEDYTGIRYPFGKFDFLAVPAFQFGGMEHPGAVWYRADALFLDPSASRSQELGRASLIAHETAHMWFGDLVTMRWFDDVWMKEVFANFMAAKIVAPAFGDIDHRLRFFLAHHPAAYAVDRTAGANPIRQDLANLRDAGSLYGAVIYQKAPIVMRQLELQVGDSALRDGLRTYLDRYRFGNAGWPELIAILDALTPQDLAAWSRVWVEEAGRPTFRLAWGGDALEVRQEDHWAALSGPWGRGPRTRELRWPQRFAVAEVRGDGVFPAGDDGSSLGRWDMRRLPTPGDDRPDFVLPGADGVTYGRYVLDAHDRDGMLAGVHGLKDPLHRAVAWQTLHEEMLDGALAPAKFVRALQEAVTRESDDLVTTQVLGLLRTAYWRFLDDRVRAVAAPPLERVLWEALDRAPTAGRKGAYFGALASVTLTPEGTDRLRRIWQGDETLRGLPLAEPQYTMLAEALALRGVPDAERILDAQEARIANPDRLARFRFVRPALHADPAVRAALFHAFRDEATRRRESWVLDALAAMNHPLRAHEALPHLRASLDLVEEIQRTGDIFFPLRWTHAALDGHQSAEAADVTARFLRERKGLPPRLRGKVLQAADDLFRAAGIVEGWEGRAAPGR